jgi:hypothetical protein
MSYLVELVLFRTFYMEVRHIINWSELPLQYPVRRRPAWRQRHRTGYSLNITFFLGRLQ